MSIKTTVLLLALLAGVGVYFLWFHEGGERALVEDEAGVSLLEPSWRAEAVDWLEMERGPEQLRFEREAGRWVQTQPVRFPLDEQRLQRAAGALAELRYYQRFEPGVDGRPDFEEAHLTGEGLRGQVRARAGDEAVQLYLGTRTIDGRGYLRVGDEPYVYVVDDALHRLVLDGRPSAWRQHHLDVPEASRVRRIELGGSEPVEAIALHHIDGRWYFDEARRARADREAVEALLGALAELSIEQFTRDHEEATEAFGLGEPRYTIALYRAVPGGDEPEHAWTLRLGRTAGLEDGGRYASWASPDSSADVVFALGEGAEAALSVEADSLRDPRVALTPAREVRELRLVRTDEEVIELLRDAAGVYRFAEGTADYQADGESTARLVRAVTGLEASAYRADFEPEGEPAVEAVLSRRGSGREERVRFYAVEVGDYYWAVRESETVGYRVDGEAVAALRQPRGMLRDRGLIDMPADEIEGVELAHGDGRSYTFVRAGDGSWSLEGEPAHEARALERLVEALGSLRARRWLGEAVEAGADWSLLELEAADGRAVRLHVDPATGRGVMAEDDAGFVLDDRLVELLMLEYRLRDVFGLEGESVREVRLEEGGEAVLLRRGGDGRVRADVDREVDQYAGRVLLDTLGELEAVRYTDRPDDIDEADRRFEIEMEDGRTFELRVVRGGDGRVWAEHGGRWFEISEAEGQVLLGPVFADEVEELDRK